MIPFYSDKEDKDFRDVAGAMASAFNTLRFEPDKGLDTALQTIKQQRSARRAKNKTVEYLRSLGQPESTRLADMVETGQLTGQQAYSQIFALEQEKRAADRAAANAARSYDNQVKLAELRHRLGLERDAASKAPAKMTEFQTRFNILKQANPAMSDADILKLVDGPAGAPQVGTIPQGYELIQSTNDAGEISLRMEPIKGGPEDESEKEQKRAASKITMTDTILNQAKKARELISPYSTGYGSLLSALPETDARQMDAYVASLKAQATVETLNSMRQESPTGGALGNVTNQENAMLAAKAGALDPMSGADVFAAQLDDYERTLLRIVHGPEMGDKIFNETRAPVGGKRIKFDAQGNIVE